MHNIIIVTPAPGIRVLDPATTPPKPLPQKGKRVVCDSYWLRRKEAGEVFFTKVPASAQPTNKLDEIETTGPQPAATEDSKTAKAKAKR